MPEIYRVFSLCALPKCIDRIKYEKGMVYDMSIVLQDNYITPRNFSTRSFEDSDTRAFHL